MARALNFRHGSVELAFGLEKLDRKEEAALESTRAEAMATVQMLRAKHPRHTDLRALEDWLRRLSDWHSG